MRLGRTRPLATEVAGAPTTEVPGEEAGYYTDPRCTLLPNVTDPAFRKMGKSRIPTALSNIYPKLRLFAPIRVLKKILNMNPRCLVTFAQQ